ncbi:MAG: hypothetical protein WA210_21045 [Burkholderiaceae bacterium]
MKPRRFALWTCTGLLLALVFMAYLRPEVAMTLAQQLWSCF